MGSRWDVVLCTGQLQNLTQVILLFLKAPKWPEFKTHLFLLQSIALRTHEVRVIDRRASRTMFFCEVGRTSQCRNKHKCVEYKSVPQQAHQTSALISDYATATGSSALIALLKEQASHPAKLPSKSKHGVQDPAMLAPPLGPLLRHARLHATTFGHGGRNSDTIVS